MDTPVIAVDVPLMVGSLAALGSSTVDLLCAVRLHAGCSLAEARRALRGLAPRLQDLGPGCPAQQAVQPAGGPRYRAAMDRQSLIGALRPGPRGTFILGSSAGSALFFLAGPGPQASLLCAWAAL